MLDQDSHEHFWSNFREPAAKFDRSWLNCGQTVTKMSAILSANIWPTFGQTFARFGLFGKVWTESTRCGPHLAKSWASSAGLFLPARENRSKIAPRTIFRAALCVLSQFLSGGRSGGKYSGGHLSMLYQLPLRPSTSASRHFLVNSEPYTPLSGRNSAGASLRVLACSWATPASTTRPSDRPPDCPTPLGARLKRQSQDIPKVRRDVPAPQADLRLRGVPGLRLQDQHDVLPAAVQPERRRV